MKEIPMVIKSKKKESKDPYKEIIKIIEKWARKNFYDYFLVTLMIDGSLKSELVIDDGMAGLIWDNDWYEGQEEIALMGFIPISNAYCIGEPERDRKAFYLNDYTGSETRCTRTN